MTTLSGGTACIHCAGIPGFWYILEASADLKAWTEVGRVQAGPTGLFEFDDCEAGHYSCRFYRTRYNP